MALTPQNSDAFFREVDEDVRRDRMMGLVERHGRTAAILLAVALLALAGFLWWRSHRAAQVAAEGEALAPVLATMEEGRAPADTAPLAAVAASPRDGYRAVAALALADALAMKGDVGGAAARYAALAADGGAPQAIRDLGLVRSVAVQADSLPPQQVIDRLRPLAVPGGAWFGSAGELTAMAELKLGHRDKAGALLAAIVRDAGVPATLRGRAAGLATVLGRDVDPGVTIGTAKE